MCETGTGLQEFGKDDLQLQNPSPVQPPLQTSWCSTTKPEIKK